MPCGYSAVINSKVHAQNLTQPGIEDDRACPLKVLDVAGDQRQSMNESRRCNQSINFVAPVGNGQMGTACGDGIVDGNDPASKFRLHMAVEPGP